MNILEGNVHLKARYVHEYIRPMHSVKPILTDLMVAIITPKQSLKGI